MKTNKLNGRTTVLDTTVILYNPDIFYGLQGRIAIPISVIKELDGLKRGDDNTAGSARKAARTLDVLGTYEEFGVHGDLARGVKLSSGGIVSLYPFYEVVDGLDSEADNRIVGAALKLKNEGQDVVLLTSDTNMRTVARAYGIKTRCYPAYMEEIAKVKVQTTRATAIPGVSTAYPLARRRTAQVDPSARDRRSTCKVKGPTARWGETRWRCLSPIYWLRKILRLVSPAKTEAPFWSMDVDQYRLCTDYRDCCIESESRARRSAK